MWGLFLCINRGWAYFLTFIMIDNTRYCAVLFGAILCYMSCYAILYYVICHVKPHWDPAVTHLTWSFFPCVFTWYRCTLSGGLSKTRNSRHFKVCGTVEKLQKIKILNFPEVRKKKVEIIFPIYQTLSWACIFSICPSHSRILYTRSINIRISVVCTVSISSQPLCMHMQNEIDHIQCKNRNS